MNKKSKTHKKGSKKSITRKIRKAGKSTSNKSTSSDESSLQSYYKQNINDNLSNQKKEDTSLSFIKKPHGSRQTRVINYKKSPNDELNSNKRKYSISDSKQKKLIEYYDKVKSENQNKDFFDKIKKKIKNLYWYNIHHFGKIKS